MAHNELASLKEWAPLTDLLNKIPTTTGGIFSQNIQLTCVDVLPEFLLLGTNIGILFWYDRKTKELEQLKCDDYKVPITCVKVVSSVEYMVACGNTNGKIILFQIPKLHSESLPENLRQSKNQVEKYTVSDLHKSPITALEWSKNGMKIFSGDQMGTVVLTELDFYMVGTIRGINGGGSCSKSTIASGLIIFAFQHMCKSTEILNETYEVIQLSYMHQKLLISTTFRSILCFQQTKWTVQQVGKKDRKILGKYGGVIYQYGFKSSDCALYCSRPGLRIWLANNTGNVEKTLLFKDILCKGCCQIQLLNPISKELENIRPQNEPTFGKLLLFANGLLITYNNDIVYIIDPDKMTILATISHLRNIIDVATYRDEIFILEEGHSLLRISYYPELENTSPSCINKSRNLFTLNTNTLLKSFTHATPLLKNSFSTKIESDTDKSLTDNNILSVNDAEEALEEQQPAAIVNGDDKQQMKNFNEISTREFEDKILYRKYRKIKNKIHKRNGESVISLNSNSSDEKESNTFRSVNIYTMGLLPDLRSPDTIISDIEYKEKILADILNLEKINIKNNTEKKETIPTEVEITRNESLMLNSIEPTIQLSNDEKIDKKNSDSKVKIMPYEWNLSSIQINNKINDVQTATKIKLQIEEKNHQQQPSVQEDDQLLSDWEII